MKTELKPCPFCGGEARMVPPDSALPSWYAGCRHCDQGFCEDSEVGAIAAWNTRADDNRRCENCKYWREPDLDADELSYCALLDIGGHGPDFFCAHFHEMEDGDE